MSKMISIKGEMDKLGGQERQKKESYEKFKREAEPEIRAEMARMRQQNPDMNEEALRLAAISYLADKKGAWHAEK